jgi:hypothetical protein
MMASGPMSHVPGGTFFRFESAFGVENGRSRGVGGVVVDPNWERLGSGRLVDSEGRPGAAIRLLRWWGEVGVEGKVEGGCVLESALSLGYIIIWKVVFDNHEF